MLESKVCTLCKKQKPLTKFGAGKKGKLSARCKKCTNKLQRDWRQNSTDAKHKMMNRKYQREYGITLDFWIDYQAKMGHCCEVCNEKKRLVPDHDHKTGTFRGALCISCNSAIGILGDDAPGVKRAMNYLLLREQSTLTKV